MVTRQRKSWRPDRNGRYTRQLGWTFDARTGVRRQSKFYLGNDLKEATRRNGRLEELWESIESLAAQGVIDPTWMPNGLWSKELDHLFDSQRPIWNDDVVGLAYAVMSAHWNQGFATEMAEASLRFGSERLGLSEIDSWTLPTNVASQRVMAKQGFRYQKDIEFAGLPHRFYRLVKGERVAYYEPTINRSQTKDE